MKLQYKMDRVEFLRNLKVTGSAFGAPGLGFAGNAINLVTWVFVGLACMSAWHVLKQGGSGSMRPLLTVIFLIFAVGGHFGYLKFCRERKLAWFVDRNGPFPVEVVTELNPSTLSTVTEGFRVEIPRKDIGEVRVLVHDVVILLRRYGPLVIPKTAFASPAELSVFVQDASGRVQS